MACKICVGYDISQYSSSLLFSDTTGVEPLSDTCHKDAYHKEKITVRISMARLVHVGIPRSGKSYTIKRLMGEIKNLLEEEKKRNISPATGVAWQVGIKHSDMATISGSSEWSKLKGFIKENKMLTQLLTQLDSTSTNSAANVFKQSSSASELHVHVKREDIVDMLSPRDTGNSKDLDDINILLQYLNELILLINTDIGGLPEFLDMLSALIMGPSLYLLYHRLIDSLDEPLKISYTYPDGKSTDEYDSTITVEETLFQVLASIACFSNPKPTESISEKYPIRSRALFVGTHLDRIKSEEELSEKQKSLKDKVANTSFYHDILLSAGNELILMVNNKTGDDNEIKEKQKVLEKVIRENFEKIEIPAAWLILSLYMRKDIDSIPRKRIMSLDDCEKQAIKLGIDSIELKSALWFLHHYMGLILYYPEVKAIKNKVFCDVQVIFDSISQLIVHTFTNTRKVGAGITEQFKKKGMFSNRDLFHAMQPSSDESNQLPLDELVKLLEHLKILTVISDSTDKIYFMPCILKTAVADQLKAALQAVAFNQNPAPLMLQYDCGFVPVGIFSHMIADIISQAAWKLAEDKIWKNMITLFVKDNEIILVSRPTHITVAFSRNSRSRTSCEQECPAIVEKIKSSLKRVTERMPYKSNAQYKFGFECKHTASPPVKQHLCLREREDGFMRCQLDQHVVYSEPSQSIWFSKVSHIINDDCDTIYNNLSYI